MQLYMYIRNDIEPNSDLTGRKASGTQHEALSAQQQHGYSPLAEAAHDVLL